MWNILQYSISANKWLIRRRDYSEEICVNMSIRCVYHEYPEQHNQCTQANYADLKFRIQVCEVIPLSSLLYIQVFSLQQRKIRHRVGKRQNHTESHMEPTRDAVCSTLLLIPLDKVCEHVRS